MTGLKSTLVKGALIAAVAAGTLAVTASSASAYVACNRFGECWRVKERYTTYPADLRVRFHDDAWRDRHQTGRWHWQADRDNDHGYWSHGEWHAF
jgi:hypothetical protein